MNSSEVPIADPDHSVGSLLAHGVPEPTPAQHRRTPRFDISTLPPAPSKWQRVVKRIDPPVQLARLVLLLAILGLWHYAVEQEWINRIFTATPKETWDGFVDIVGTKLFWEDLIVTLREAVFGFVIGGAARVAHRAPRWPLRAAREGVHAVPHVRQRPAQDRPGPDPAVVVRRRRVVQDRARGDRGVLHRGGADAVRSWV